MEADYSSKLISDSENLPDDGKRKKAVVQQTITMPQIQSYGGFEYIKAAVSFLLRRPLHCVSGMAALGGSRHATKTASTNSDRG